MADKKISQLTGATTPLAGTEVLPIVQGGSTVKVSVDNLTAGKAVSAASLATTGNIVSNTLLRVTNAGQIEQNDGNGGLYFLNSSPTATTTNMRFLTTDASGVAQTNLQLTGGATRINLFNGSVRLGIAGTGVDFNANTPAAGMTSQLLNWYEEGTWTPAFTLQSGSVTLATALARYTRIGRQVTVNAYVKIGTPSSPSGFMLMTGLPFAPLDISGNSIFAGSIIVNTMLTTVTGNWSVQPRANGDLRFWVGDNTTLSNPGANLQADSEIWVTCTYVV